MCGVTLIVAAAQTLCDGMCYNFPWCHSDHSLSQLIITDMAGVKPQLQSLKCYDLMKMHWGIQCEVCNVSEHSESKFPSHISAGE